jgi:ribosomal protein L7/L12
MAGKKITLTPEQETEIINLLKKGERIQAVKVCLGFTNAGLKVAKDLVDEISDRLSKLS